MITRSREYMAEPVPGELLRSVVREHRAGLVRLDALRDAYENRRGILARERASGLPNNRLAHGFARYIVTMAAGYLIGKPVSYQAQEGQEGAMDAMREAYRRTDADSVDAELAKDAATYGRAVELLYADAQARPRTASLDPRAAFVVYDDTVAGAPLFGVHITPRTRLDGAPDGFAVAVYTGNMAYTYRVNSPEELGGAQPERAEPHYFGGVPMIEYWNGEDERGDFEQVQSLIDAYDALQSDRVNDKQQFVDALLVLTGVHMEPDGDGRSPARQLREDKVLCLPDNEARAEFLAKTMAEADAEVLKDAIKADIHKFSMVPDLTDEQFAGNASGVAMKFKLLGLEQLMRIKERWFREALRERLRRFAAFLAVKGAPALDAETVTMTFTRSLPVNELEVAQTVQAYAGLVPDELLLAQVPFVEDVDDALARLHEQQQEAARRQQQAFGMPMTEEEDDGAAE